MKRIPINVEKIKVLQEDFRANGKKEIVQYLFRIFEKNQDWQKTILCGRDELIKFRDEIDKIIEETTTAEVLSVSIEKADIIDEHYKSDSLCKDCNFKLTHKCIECLFVLQSPLERQLYLKLSNTRIHFQTQYALNWKGEFISVQGKSYGNTQNNFKDVLTIVDFYIERKQTKLCIYTDGHTYHERTEEQAQRDRNIDRKLQELGFQVLRYTGKDVKENSDKIIDDIKKWIK